MLLPAMLTPYVWLSTCLVDKLVYLIYKSLYKANKGNKKDWELIPDLFFYELNF